MKASFTKGALICAILAIALLPTDLLCAEPISVKNLVPDGFGEGRQPQVTVTPAGMIVVVFARNNSIYSVQSADESKSFSAT
jgi:hypothetical protein